MLYNPIDDHLLPDNTPRDPQKLLFLSSPIKGLEEVLNHFIALNERVKKPFHLYVADPGYKIKGHRFSTDTLKAMDNVIVLGALSHDKVIAHLRDSFCIFYPQQTFSETFGIIYAEANAVGTPVISHDIGSAKEVLGGGSQIININEPNRILKTLEDWQARGAPVVSVNPAFRLSAVISAWEALLGKSILCN